MLVDMDSHFVPFGLCEWCFAFEYMQVESFLFSCQTIYVSAA